MVGGKQAFAICDRCEMLSTGTSSVNKLTLCIVTMRRSYLNNKCTHTCTVYLSTSLHCYSPTTLISISCYRQLNQRSGKQTFGLNKSVPNIQSIYVQISPICCVENLTLVTNLCTVTLPQLQTRKFILSLNIHPHCYSFPQDLEANKPLCTCISDDKTSSSFAQCCSTHGLACLPIFSRSTDGVQI